MILRKRKVKPMSNLVRRKIKYTKSEIRELKREIERKVLLAFCRKEDAKTCARFLEEDVE